MALTASLSYSSPLVNYSRNLFLFTLHSYDDNRTCQGIKRHPKALSQKPTTSSQKPSRCLITGHFSCQTAKKLFFDRDFVPPRSGGLLDHFIQVFDVLFSSTC